MKTHRAWKYDGREYGIPEKVLEKYIPGVICSSRERSLKNKQKKDKEENIALLNHDWHTDAEMAPDSNQRTYSQRKVIKWYLGQN